MAMRDDANQVDVHLDCDFNILSAPADHEGSSDGHNAPGDAEGWSLERIANGCGWPKGLGE
jgi:hypothetical protein